MLFLLLTVALIIILLLWVFSLRKISRDESRSFVRWFPEISPPPDVPQVRIIAPREGQGRYIDAQIYARLIPHSTVVYTDRFSCLSDSERYREVDINLWMEQLIPDVFPAKQNWLLVNHQWLEYDPQKLSSVDLFLVKSRSSERLIQRIVQKHNLPGKVKLVKTSSPNVYPGEEIVEEKDWNLLLHLGGGSENKNTRQLLRTWIARKGFPEYGSPVLAFTCFGSCERTIVDLLLGWISHPDGYKYHPEIPTLRWYGDLSEENLMALERKAGAFIVIPSAEEFSHSRNEARAASSVLIVPRSYPPLGNFQVHCSPVPSQRVTRWPDTIPHSEGCVFTDEALAATIEEYLRAPLDKKQEMGKENRKKYEEDTRFFTLSVYSLLK